MTTVTFQVIVEDARGGGHVVEVARSWQGGSARST